MSEIQDHHYGNYLLRYACADRQITKIITRFSFARFNNQQTIIFRAMIDHLYPFHLAELRQQKKIWYALAEEAAKQVSFINKNAENAIIENILAVGYSGRSKKANLVAVNPDDIVSAWPYITYDQLANLVSVYASRATVFQILDLLEQKYNQRNPDNILDFVIDSTRRVKLTASAAKKLNQCAALTLGNGQFPLTDFQMNSAHLYAIVQYARHKIDVELSSMAASKIKVISHVADRKIYAKYSGVAILSGLAIYVYTVFVTIRHRFNSYAMSCEVLFSEESVKGVSRELDLNDGWISINRIAHLISQMAPELGARTSLFAQLERMDALGFQYKVRYYKSCIDAADIISIRPNVKCMRPSGDLDQLFYRFALGLAEKAAS